MVNEWKLRLERPDNHWLDCLVGFAVAVAMQGMCLPDVTPVAEMNRPPIKFSENQRLRRMACFGQCPR